MSYSYLSSVESKRRYFEEHFKCFSCPNDAIQWGPLTFNMCLVFTVFSSCLNSYLGFQLSPCLFPWLLSPTCSLCCLINGTASNQILSTLLTLHQSVTEEQTLIWIQRLYSSSSSPREIIPSRTTSVSFCSQPNQCASMTITLSYFQSRFKQTIEVTAA